MNDKDWELLSKQFYKERGIRANAVKLSQPGYVPTPKPCSGCGIQMERAYGESNYAFRKRKFHSFDCWRLFLSRTSKNRERIVLEELSKGTVLDEAAKSAGVSMPVARKIASTAGIKVQRIYANRYQHEKSNRAVCYWLKRKGFNATPSSFGSRYDVMVNGKRVEIKVSCPDESGQWNFNIHRHNKLDESKVDVYILRLESVPELGAPVHLIVPSPIGRYTLTISLRMLIIKWCKFAEKFELLS